jgi:hypothetical protein
MHHASENVVTHVVSRIRANSGEVRTLNWVSRLFFPVVRHFLLSIKYHPSQDVQWYPTTGARAIDKAISRACALRKLGTYQLLFSWEYTLQPVTSETGEMAVFERLKRPRQLTGKFLWDLHVQNASNVVELPRPAVPAMDTSLCHAADISRDVGQRRRFLLSATTP